MPRPPLEQNFTQFPLTVLTTPTPIGNNFGLTSMIDSFVICVPNAAGREVYFGDETVSTTTGLEIGIGISVNFATDNQRQLYEIQNPLLRLLFYLTKVNMLADTIPFPVWNLSRSFLVATASTDVRIIIFRSVFN